MPELPLNDRQRDPLVGHLDRVHEPELVGRKAASHPGIRGQAAQLSACGGRRPATALVGPARMQNSGPIGSWTRCSVQRATCSHPQSSIPTIRRVPPFPGADQHRARLRVQIGFGERERLADPQPCPPEDRDQTAGAVGVATWSGLAHDEDDLLDGGRVGWVALPLCSAARIPRCGPAWPRVIAAGRSCQPILSGT